MARLRSNAREAPRFQHQGQGQYESGYQYRRPDRPFYTHGPWNKVLPHGRRDLPADALAHLQDGILIDGMIFPVWKHTVEQAQSNTILGAFTVDLIAGTYMAIFYSDVAAANRLKIELVSQSSTTVVDTGLTVASGFATAVGWQNSIYFSHLDLGAIYRYDILTATLSQLVSTNAEYLFMLDNNLVAIRPNGTAHEVKWSVDGNPNDWSGYGSGAIVIPGHVGKPQGFGFIGRSAIILGNGSGWLMTPTGTVPAFRFDDEKNFPGTPYDHAFASTNDTIYFVSAERKLAAFFGGQTVELGMGESRFDQRPALFMSKALGQLIISTDDPVKVLMLDPISKQWVSDFDETWNFIADSPLDGPPGKVIGFKNTGNQHQRTILDIGAATYTMPNLRTGMTRFKQPMMIHHVDVQHTDLISYAPLLEVLCLQENGSIVSYSFGETRRDDIRVLGQVARFWVDAIAYGIELHTLTPNESVGFYDPATVLTVGGNYPWDGTTVIGRDRADANLSGNLVTSAASKGYTTGFTNPSGNVEAVLDLDQWPKNIGIDYIDVFARSLQSAAPTRA